MLCLTTDRDNPCTMRTLQRTCRISGKDYIISPLEQRLCTKLGVPLPTLHPYERMLRLTAFSNFTTLFHGQCHATNKPLLKFYRDEQQFPVYSSPHWWSDNWNPLTYGRDYDFDRPFFTQFSELKNSVPQPALAVQYTTLENCEYVNGASHCKNCYLLFHGAFNEDCYFCKVAWRSRDCIDCTSIYDCELCYDCNSISNCYDIRHGFNCKNCSSSAFLWNCISCSDCFCCTNLRHQRFCYFNEYLGESEYRKRIKQVEFDNWRQIEELRGEYLAFVKREPQPAIRGVEFGQSTGDFLYNCENVYNSYECMDLQDCLHCLRAEKSTDCVDFYAGTGCELLYGVLRAGYSVHNAKFCYFVLTNCSDLEYCMMCINCRKCFGCVGLRHHEYCILNQQYTRSEYEELRSRIIKQMNELAKRDPAQGYGEFFPASLSLVPYQDSDAAIFFKLSKEEADSRGLLWSPEKPASMSPYASMDDLPLRTRDLDDSVTEKVFACASTGRPFSITAAELERYRNREIPYPRHHWKSRLLDRQKLRNPFQLQERTCPRTGRHILSTYPPESEWVVWDSDEYTKHFGS